MGPAVAYLFSGKVFPEDGWNFQRIEISYYSLAIIAWIKVKYIKTTDANRNLFATSRNGGQASIVEKCV